MSSFSRCHCSVSSRCSHQQTQDMRQGECYWGICIAAGSHQVASHNRRCQAAPEKFPCLLHAWASCITGIACAGPSKPTSCPCYEAVQAWLKETPHTNWG